MSTETNQAKSFELNESGAVLIEWSIVIIGMLLGLLMFVDVANMLLTYSVLSQSAFEGARSAQSFPQLEAGTTKDLAPTAAEYASCTSSASASGFPCGHYLAQERARYAAQVTAAHTHWIDAAPALSITCQYIPRGSAGGAATEDTVIVSVTATFSGFLFRGFPLWASFEGPYLFQS